METKRTTREQEQDERETAGFAARTLIDDTIGKLHYIRNRIFMDVPLDLEGHLLDAEAHIEVALVVAEHLPEAPPASEGWMRPSASDCLGEGCSCGMPDWTWTAAGKS